MGEHEPVPPTEDLLAFLAASPSPYHAVAEGARRLDAAGFTEAALGRPWPGGAGRRYLRRGGALLAWTVPEGAGPLTPFRIVGAHTDSPGLRVKPTADTGSVGWKQIAVEPYGGPLLNSWLDRDLGVAGRLVTRDGTVHLVRLDLPLLRVPQLAIHLDRAANDGLVLDRQRHLVPVWGLGTARGGEFAAVLADAAEVGARDIAAWDLALFDLTPPGLLGLDEEFVVAARLDNQFSCWAALASLVAAEAEQVIGVVALFDHEEVGSGSATGAEGPLLPDLLERTVLAAGGDREDLHRALAGSMLVSADMAHAVHPNYPERSEPGHLPLPNGGPVVKVNANQRYATDARTAAAFQAVCRAADVPWQVFVSNSSVSCGSTIGPALGTRLGIDTVDVGCAQLSMHSVREMAGSDDAGHLLAALTAFYSG